jgi:hypothetical protein
MSNIDRSKFTLYISYIFIASNTIIIIIVKTLFHSWILGIELLRKCSLIFIGFEFP